MRTVLMVGQRVEILPFHDHPNRLNLWAGDVGEVIDFQIHDDCHATVLVLTDGGSRVWRDLLDVKMLSEAR